MNTLYIIDSKQQTKPSKTLSNIAINSDISLTISGKEGSIKNLQRTHYDIVIVQQYDIDTRIIKDIRKNRIITPVVILYKNSTPEIIAEILSLGADDCIPLSVHPIELYARLHSIVRRSSGHNSLLLKIGRLSVSLNKREAQIDNNKIPLTRKEYDLLEILIIRKEQTISKDSLLDTLYRGENEPNGKIIDVMISKIRRKIREFGIDNPFITIWGVGYRINKKSFSPIILDQPEKIIESSREYSIPINPGISIADR